MTSIGRNKVRPASDAVTLQWANGKTLARQEPGQGRFTPLVGFHVEVGKDESFDAAAAAAGIQQIEIKHQRSGGAEIVRHWYFGEGTLVVHPVTSGPVAETMAGCIRSARETAEAGIGARWADGERSKLAVRVILRHPGLLTAGYTTPVQLSTRSRMTDVLLEALLDHLRVCEAADGLIDRSKHPELVSFHEVGLPLGPGEEAEWGKGDTATVVPFMSYHQEDVTADYLRTVWRSDAIHAAAIAAWDGIQSWAAEYAVNGNGHSNGHYGEE